ncbi:hypothetical protein [Brachyspira sp.]|uniref:hypothetical protein n=1 Tax=Brachyspira sp. TaxID=1977261 RepID=UPI003D7DB776
MTEKEKQQLEKDIEDGKVDIDDLYEKYQCYLPYLPTQEAIERREGRKFTDEEWNKWVEEAEINFLDMQVNFDTNSIIKEN